MTKTDTTKKRQEKHKGFTKKIGNTTYDVSFHYSRQSREKQQFSTPKEMLDIILGATENIQVNK
jgi:hypothetical protein